MKSSLRLLILIVVAVVATAAMACREEGNAIYLDGKQLMAPLEVFELQGGVVGLTGTYYAIEPDGVWLSGPILPGKGEKGTPAARGTLSSAQLAGTFNALGRDAWNSAGFGVLMAILIIFLGHALNLLLSLMSGVVHGLRLNCIEFFNWSLPDEGYLFNAFAKKARQP